MLFHKVSKIKNNTQDEAVIHTEGCTCHWSQVPFLVSAQGPFQDIPGPVPSPIWGRREATFCGV